MSLAEVKVFIEANIVRSLKDAIRGTRGNEGTR